MNTVSSLFKFLGETLGDDPDNLTTSDKTLVGAINEIKTSLIDSIYPVGSYYETSNTSFDPNVTFGGTWALETAGQVHVSAGTGYTVAGALTNTSDGGEATHTLTTDEMPSHTHTISYAQYGRGTGGSTASALEYSGSTETTSATGGGNPHNNMMPYIIVNRWHRIV